ncbi:olfactory receptor 4Q3-like [Watersipora subatra]|uniref:olfactory receptor 4Q3-like n=1 Tax=Watersipora subatra TaxID=2589382 RepID=UPI00355C0E14
MEGNESLLVVCPLEEHHLLYFVSSLMINIFSVAANILHVITLWNIPSVRTQNYFWILFHLSLADVAFSCMALPRFFQTLPNFSSVSYQKVHIGYVFSDGLILSAMYSRYALLTLASFDRYYAICRPFKYKSSKILNEIHKVSLVLWIINTVFCVAVMYLPAATCILRGRPASDMSEHHKTLTIILLVSYTTLPLVVSTVLLCFTYRELQQMKERLSFNESQRELLNTYHFIAGSFIILYVTLVPLVMTLFMHVFSFDDKDLAIYVATQVSFTSQSLFGLANIVFYAVLNPQYLTKVKEKFNFLRPIRIGHRDEESSEN